MIDFRRKDEMKAALYSGGVGALFMIQPDLLRQYPAALGGPDQAWLVGASLMMASLGHVFALWLNGGAPPIARVIRFSACIWHAYMLGIFLFVFVTNGLWWGAASISYVFADVLSALHRVWKPNWRGGSWV